MYDLIIVGGGPAAVSAGVVAARKKLKTLVVSQTFGGQWIVAETVKNFVGFESISGLELAKALEKHLRAQEGIEIKDQTTISKIAKSAEGFSVKTDKGEVFEAKTILMASGTRYRKLGIPGEKEFEGRGVFYCATCDAPLMKNKTVAVIGGGNSAFGAAESLLPYASKIYILDRSEAFSADIITQDKVKNSGKAEMLDTSIAQEITGDKFVKSLKYQNLATKETKELAVEGIFISIGHEPNSDIIKNLVQINDRFEIIVDPKTQKTSLEGIWAAGDITDTPYKQGTVAAGDAMKAALNIYDYLKND